MYTHPYLFIRIHKAGGREHRRGSAASDADGNGPIIMVDSPHLRAATGLSRNGPKREQAEVGTALSGNGPKWEQTRLSGKHVGVAAACSG